MKAPIHENEINGSRTKYEVFEASTTFATQPETLQFSGENLGEKTAKFGGCVEAVADIFIDASADGDDGPVTRYVFMGLLNNPENAYNIPGGDGFRAMVENGDLKLSEEADKAGAKIEQVLFILGYGTALNRKATLVD